MSDNTFSDLRKPFPTKNINWKVGAKLENGAKGQAVPHLDARAVQNRLDDVVGPSGWKNKFVEVFNGPTLFSVRCILSLKIDGEWVDKEDAATLSSANSDGYIDRNTATKGVYSDALKRAAVQWGIGRYLYDYECEVVDLDEQGKLCKTPKLSKEFVLAEEHAEYYKEAVVQPEPAAKVVEEVSVKATATVGATEPVVAAKEIVTARANANPAIPPVESVKATAVAKPVTTEAGYPHDLPAGLTESEKYVIKELLGKLEKNPPNIIKTYVLGPKGVQKLGEAARDYVVKKADEKEAAMKK